MFLREDLPRDRGTSRHTVESRVPCFRLPVIFVEGKHGIRSGRREIGHFGIASIPEFLEYLERG